MKKLLLTFLAIASFVISANAATVTSNGGYYEASYASDCMPGIITFNALATPPGATSKKIMFSDGTGLTTWTGATINHSYAHAGEYDVYVIYYDAAGSAIYYDYCRIELFGQPGPVQTYGTTTACPGDKVRFYVMTGWTPYGSDYTFAWDFGDGSPVQTSNDYDVKHAFPAPGTYNITVTANGPCGGPYISTGTFTVSSSAAISPSDAYINFPVTEVCPNQQVYVYYNEDFPSIFIYWGDGSYSTTNDHLHSYSAPGTYYPSITLTNGCGNSVTVTDTITVRTDLTWGSPGMGYIDVYNSSPVCPGTDVYFNAWANASQYTWTDELGNILSTDSYFEQSFPSIGSATVYVTITNGCGFDTTIYTTVNVVNSIPVSAGEFDPYVPASVCTGAMFNYSGEGFSDPEAGMTWSWDFGDGSTSSTFSGAHEYTTPGTYNVTVTGVNSCGQDSVANFTVTVGSGIAPDPASLLIGIPDGDAGCIGDSIMVYGLYYNPGGSYLIDFGDGVTTTSVNILNIGGVSYFYVKHPYTAAGAYTVSCTYTNECGLSLTKTTTATVGTNEMPSGGIFYDESQAFCLGEPVTFLSYGGSQFQWNFGDGTGSVVTYGVFENVDHVYENPGSYTITLVTTNSCGNSQISSENIIIPDNRINVTTNTIDAQCQQADGKAIAVITGGLPPYNVTWSNGSNDILVDSLSAGIYVCNVTDENGCYNFGIATVSDAQAPAIVVSTVVDVTCYGGNDGAIDINVIGSTPPYNFNWSNGSFNEDLSGLVAGPYEVIVTDANGCIATASINVNQPDKVDVSFLSTDSDCGASTGSITAIAGGTTGPFTYVWSNGSTGNTLFNVPLGIYEVNVIDSKGCVVTEQSVVNEDNGSGGPVIAAASIGDLDCSGSGAAIDIEVYFSTGSLTYDWSTGATTQDITVTDEGSYNVTVTDGTGCSAIGLFEITHAAPSGQALCIVTVDSLYSANRIIWEKPTVTDIKEYKIYRESSLAGLYYHIGTVPYDSLSVFTDVVANPMIHAWRYKISAVDFCGTESSLSDPHKTIHLNQNLGLAPGSVNLIWDDYEGFSIATYNVVRYTASSGYVTLSSLSSLNHSYTDPSAPLSDSTLFYIITVDLVDPCTATRAQNNNTVRSNRTDNAVAPPFLDPNTVTEYVNGINYSHVYPNPANTMATVEFEVETPDNYTIQITDAIGQQVFVSNCGRVELFHKQEIDLQGMENGMYLVNLISSKGIVTKRLIKL